MRFLELAQGERLTVFQQSVRERFQEGGSILSVVAVLALIVLLIWGVHLWSRHIEQRKAPGANLSAWGLFKSVVTRLQLGKRERRILLSAARSSGLENPAVLLLSRSMFDRHVGIGSVRAGVPSTAQKTDESSSESPRANTIAELRANLFPSAD